MYRGYERSKYKVLQEHKVWDWGLNSEKASPKGLDQNESWLTLAQIKKKWEVW